MLAHMASCSEGMEQIRNLVTINLFLFPYFLRHFSELMNRWAYKCTPKIEQGVLLTTINGVSNTFWNIHMH